MSKSGLLRGLPLADRMRRQTRVTDGCWEWTGGVDNDGYGRISGQVDGVRYQKAHRVAWVLHNQQPIPANMVVCHSCDNRRCVNPAHLWLGTQEENQLDKIGKGRHITVRGEAHPEAKLTEDQVRAILADARTHTEIAYDYGIKASTVSSIKTRKSWAHLDVESVAKAKRKGTRTGKSDRITPEIVREIRETDTPGHMLADKFGVSRQLITNIRKRRCWNHVV
jgi:hypothetical protein